MRWNGVSLLGLTIAGTGLAGCMVLQTLDIASGPDGSAMALAIAVFASGALIACLGAYLTRLSETAPRFKSKLGWQRSAAQRRTARNARNFGQRAEYGALPQMASAPASQQVSVPARLMIGGPR